MHNNMQMLKLCYDAKLGEEKLPFTRKVRQGLSQGKVIPSSSLYWSSIFLLSKNKGQKNKELTKIPKKSVSVISQIFPFFGDFSKFPFFDTLAQKARTPKTL